MSGPSASGNHSRNKEWGALSRFHQVCFQNLVRVGWRYVDGAAQVQTKVGVLD